MKAGIFLFALLFPICSFAQFFIDLEGGAAFTGYNKVRIPNSTGTFLNLNEDLRQDFSGFFRMRTGVLLNEKHHVSALIAPLRINYLGTTPYPLIFEGVNFPSGELLNASYRFDSYRLTYRYMFLRREKIVAGAGITGKVRDASITYISGDIRSSSDDLGVVPLINFFLQWRPTEKDALTFDGDALAAPQGRAADVALFYNRKFYRHLWLKAGYRILEGGSDSRVYNFALIHYAALGVVVNY
jgi:hypothetical protein